VEVSCPLVKWKGMGGWGTDFRKKRRSTGLLEAVLIPASVLVAGLKQDKTGGPKASLRSRNVLGGARVTSSL